MIVTLEIHAWIKVEFYWPEKVSYNPGSHKFTFFTCNRQRSDVYNYVLKLQETFPNLFDFDFYEEEGAKCVMFYPKEKCFITFK